MEKWKPVQGYEGFYEVSNKGRVRSVDRYVKQRDKFMQLKKGKVLSPAKNRLGYMCVALSKENKLSARIVHRLVAIAFIENPNGYREVNHKDCDKANNRSDNLEWCSRSFNIRHAIRHGRISYNRGEKHHATKLTDKQVMRIRKEYDGQKSCKAIGAEYGVSLSVIWNIVTNKTYKHLLTSE